MTMDDAEECVDSLWDRKDLFAGFGFASDGPEGYIGTIGDCAGKLAVVTTAVVLQAEATEDRAFLADLDRLRTAERLSRADMLAMLVINAGRAPAQEEGQGMGARGLSGRGSPGGQRATQPSRLRT